MEIKVTTSVFPRPGGYSSILSQPPPLEIRETMLCWSPITYSIKQGKLSLRIPLLKSGSGTSEGPDNENTPNPSLPWQEKNGKLLLHVMERRMAVLDSIKYELQLLCVFDSPRGQEPIVIEWCRRFFPGGLPTLGKKR